jgi:hypothetical protein
VPAHQNANEWIDPSAFLCPGVSTWVPGTPCLIGTNSTNLAPIGRFGNSRVGVVEGPGTVNLNAGLSKVFSLTECFKLTTGASFTNILNHLNLSDPNLDITSGNFGKITQSRASDFGGPRTGLLSCRLDF